MCRRLEKRGQQRPQAHAAQRVALAALVSLGISAAPRPSSALTKPAVQGNSAATRAISGVADRWMGTRLRVALAAKDTAGTGVIFGFAATTTITRAGKTVPRTGILAGDRVDATLTKTDRGWVAVSVRATPTPKSGQAGASSAFGAGGDPFAATPGPAAASPRAAPPASPSPGGAPPTQPATPRQGGSSTLSGDLGDALGGLGEAEPKPKPSGKRKMSRREAVDGILRACRANPSQRGCRNLKAACRTRAWKGDMLRICPALGVRRQGRGGSRPLALTAKHRKVAAACRQRPGHASCRRLRRLCHQGYTKLSPENRWICDRIGAGRSGGGRRAAAAPSTHATFGGAALGLTLAQRGQRNVRAWGGHLTLSNVPRRGLLAYAVELDLAKGGKGWLWDASIQYGVGGTLRRRFGWRLSGGIRGSGWTGGELATAWSVPVEVAFRLYLSRRLVACVAVRPSWNISDVASRKGGSSSLPFADELRVTAGVVWGRQRRSMGTGLFIGARYQELAGGKFIGLLVGLGYTSKP